MRDARHKRRVLRVRLAEQPDKEGTMKPKSNHKRKKTQAVRALPGPAQPGSTEPGPSQSGPAESRTAQPGQADLKKAASSPVPEGRPRVASTPVVPPGRPRVAQEFIPVTGHRDTSRVTE